MRGAERESIAKQTVTPEMFSTAINWFELTCIECGMTEETVIEIVLSIIKSIENNPLEVEEFIEETAANMADAWPVSAKEARMMITNGGFLFQDPSFDNYPRANTPEVITKAQRLPENIRARLPGLSTKAQPNTDWRILAQQAGARRKRSQEKGGFTRRFRR